MLKHISSRTNEEIREVAALREAAGRKRQQRFIAEGKRVCLSLIGGGMQLQALYVTLRGHEEIATSVAEKKMVLVDDHVMEKISQSTSPSGILGVFTLPKPSDASLMLTPGLVLARLADPGNMGTLIRTAAAMNVHTIVAVDCVDPWSPKVVQASAGASVGINIFTISWEEFLAHKGEHGLCALITKGGQQPTQLDLQKNFLVVGSEAHGIPQEWLAACDQKVTLPMPGRAESLNAAVAGSIALYLGLAK